MINLACGSAEIQHPRCQHPVDISRTPPKKTNELFDGKKKTSKITYVDLPPAHFV